jgi:hypothetical protein
MAYNAAVAGRSRIAISRLVTIATGCLGKCR